MLVFENHEQYGFDITVFAAYRKSRYLSVTDVLYQFLRIPNDIHYLHSLLFFFLEAHHQLSTPLEY